MGRFGSFVWAFALFALVCHEVAAKSVRPRHVPVGIVNGTDAAKGEFPYLVQIRDENQNFRCGGSIIGANWVLTAGHCVEELIPDSIVYGTNVLYDGSDTPNTTIKVKRFLSHPKYAEVDTGIGDMPIYDIGLLELAEPIVFSDNAKPIKLVEGGAAVPIHVNGTLAGWGVPNSDDPFVAPESYLQKVTLQLLSDEECRKRIDDYVQVDIFNATHDLCSDDHLNGECYGDSGSPFVINGTQYGVVSWSVKPCGSNPGTYSRLPTPDYRQFIKDVAGI